MPAKEGRHLHCGVLDIREKMLINGGAGKGFGLGQWVSILSYLDRMKKIYQVLITAKKY